MPATRRRSATDDGFVVQVNNATGATSFWQKDDNHSIADRRGVSTVDYIHAMYGFLRQAKCRRVLMIGCGGGTLATMLRRVGVAVTIADIDRRSFEIASTYFHLPDDVDCHVADGEAFLRRQTGRYDAIVLDAYCDGEIPHHMRKRRFFNLVKSRLRARGALVLVNLMMNSAHDHGPDRLARLMARTWRDVRLLDAPDRKASEGRNAVALAGSVRKLTRPRLLMRPLQGARTLTRELRELEFRPVRV
jgi:spermidine synthase